MRTAAMVRKYRIAIAILALGFTFLGGLHPVLGNHLNELILFDRAGDDKGFDEGLIRQRLGLLDADGKPMTVDGNLSPLVSADGTKAAYDMAGGNEPTFDSRFVEMRNDGGVLTVFTHGRKGVIVVDRKRVKGFGAGTGNTEACVEAPVRLRDARTNVTVNMVVCNAREDGGGITAVSRTLSDEIVNKGGSVATMNADVACVTVELSKRWRARTGYTPTAGEVAAANAALATVLGGTPIKDQYKKLQDALDAAVPPDVNGSKIIARLSYRATIGAAGGNVVIQEIPGDLDSDEVIETADHLDTECGATPILDTSWGTIKALYR